MASRATTKRRLEQDHVAVDVGVPAYGRPHYIVDAIESVLAQTLGSWRLVISENAPGGGEVEAAVRPYLRDSRVSYTATGGIPPEDNWTRLIQQGSARYVALLHDDDWWEPEFLARRVAFLDAHPECAFAFGANTAVDQDGRWIGEEPLLFPERPLMPEEFVPRYYRRNFISPPTIVVRRTAYEDVGPAFDGRFIFFDYEMFMRMAIRFPVGYIAARDAAHRMHEAKMTYTHLNWGEDWVRFVEHVDPLVARDRPTLPLSARLRRRRRSGAHLSAGLDALERGEPERSRFHLRRGLTAHPPSVLDPRCVVMAVMLLLGGERGRRTLARVRFFVLRRHLRVHLRRT